MSESSRDWGIRLLALGIAIGVWFNASVEDRLVSSEKLVEANVIYNRPRGFIVLDQVQNVNVRLLGSKKAIRQLSPYMVDVQVDLNQSQEGPITINLGRDNVLAPEGLDVVSIEPNTIQVELEREVSQRLPVVPHVIGKPPAGTVFDEPEVFPNQVLVTGPESQFSKIQSLSTAPIDITGHLSTFEETVAVVPPNPLIQIVQPSRVSVRIPVKPPPQATGEDEAQERKDEP
ncbi:MAG TPA: CdaR family protein [Thermoanaerobaculia bacterium]|nr:CdaR family protein [Thermoanaerobaculia bacterium]